MENKNSKIGLCGYGNCNIVNGQTLKYTTIVEALQNMIHGENIMTVDYSLWKKKPFSVLMSYLNLFIKCGNVMIFPDENAFRFMIPLGIIAKRLFSSEFHYIVIGGWLPQYCRHHPSMIKNLKKVDGIFVETRSMKRALESLGFDNIEVLPNFKICTPSFVSKGNPSTPIRAFYLARIESKKGTIPMIETISKINKDKISILLDVYGPIHPEFEDEFKDVINQRPNGVHYNGVVEPSDILKKIADYDFQIFPTLYKTEGLPGSLLDSFYAGVPVVASSWNSADEFIHDGVTGRIFELGNFEELEKVLRDFIERPEQLSVLRRGCLQMADRFDSKAIISDLLMNIHYEKR